MKFTGSTVRRIVFERMPAMMALAWIGFEGTNVHFVKRQDGCLDAPAIGSLVQWPFPPNECHHLIS
jgi:hypothetical protein